MLAGLYGRFDKEAWTDVDTAVSKSFAISYTVSRSRNI